MDDNSASCEVIEIPELCPICYACKPEPDLLICQHSFCKQCLKSHIQTLVQTGIPRDLKCPQLGCNQVISSQNTSLIRALDITDDVRNRWIKILRNREVAADPDLKFCPKAGCEGTVKRPALTSEKISIPLQQLAKQTITKTIPAKCDKCDAEVCFRCGNPWHPRIDCDKAVEPAFRRFVAKQQAKECPHCGLVTLRADGCMHMKCTSCAKHWCWRCGQAYDNKGNHLCPLVSWLRASPSKRICIQWCIYFCELSKITFILPTILFIFIIQSICQHFRTFARYPLYPFTHHTFIFFDQVAYIKKPLTKQRQILVLAFFIPILVLYPIYLAVMLLRVFYLLIFKEVVANLCSLMFCCRLTLATRTRMSM